MGTDAVSPEPAPAAASASARAVDDPRRVQAKLRWRCRRGMRELDALLERFLDRSYPSLSAADKRRFSQLLELPDPELHAYLMGWYEASEPGVPELLARIRAR